MAAAIPITNGHMSAGALYTQPVAEGVTTAPPATGGPSSSADMQGTGELMGLHNTPMHVGAYLLLAGAMIALIHFGGFRFVFDVGAGG